LRAERQSGRGDADNQARGDEFLEAFHGFSLW
jgi:hypothetical protein